jgi:hypothetical protein
MMKNLQRLALFIPLTWIILAAPAQNPAPAIVEGIVLNAATGEPVANILVLMRSPNSGRMQTATSASDGRFRIDDVAPGQNILTASGKGFVKTSRSGPTMLMLRPDEHRRNVRLQVQPPGVISGRVLDENRRPKSGINIQLFRYGYDEGRRILIPVDSVPSQFATNDLGDYRLFDLAAGEYLVAAMLSRNATRGRAQSPPVFYPGVTDPQLAVPITVAAGSEAGGTDFALTASTATSYAVRIKLSGFTPGISNLMLRPLPRGGPPLHEAFSNSGTSGCAAENNDTWLCNLMPGQYDILARTLTSSEAGSKYGSVFVDVVNRNVDAPTLTLNSGIAIQGRISVPDNLAEKIVFPDLNVLLRRIYPGDMWFSSQSEDFGAIKSDGTFQMQAFEGRYHVRVTDLPQSIYVESARYAGRNVLDSALTIEHASSGALELVVNGPAAQLTGVVRNAKGDPVPSAFITLVPSGARRDNPSMYEGSVTDDTGTYAVKGIPPGEYSVLAWEDADPQALMNRTFVERFEQRAVKITLGRGDVKELTLTAVPEN